VGVLEEITACLRRRLKGEIDTERLDALVSGIATDISSQIGGREVYVNKRPRSEYARRNAEIRGEFNGRNHDELARRHGVSRRQIYRLLKL